VRLLASPLVGSGHGDYLPAATCTAGMQGARAGRALEFCRPTRATIPAVGPILWSHSWHHVVSSTREVPSLPSVVGGPGYDSTPAPPFLKTFYPLVERSHGDGLAGLT
jgi:hypothetical protein